MIVTTGNNGLKDRSDCAISLELTESGGNQITLRSKVASLYGKHIIDLCTKILLHFTIKNSILVIEDKGALDFVIAARLEAAIKELISTEKEFLLDMLAENQYETAFDRARVTRLYLPGNTPSLMINAGVHQPDGIILDLEDAVAIHKKKEAQILVRNALRSLDFMGVERMVRINQMPLGLEDLNYIVPHNVNLILVPKCESAQQLLEVNERINSIQRQKNTKNPIWLMPIIESALGLQNVYEIAAATKNVVAIAIGLEDFTADLGVQRTNEGTETLFARSQLINACKAKGIQAIDSVFSSVDDQQALIKNVLKSKALGFEGMGCIHPRQIKIVKENFAPNLREIDYGKKVVLAFDQAILNGLGVVSLGSKMIDAPVVKRAQTTIDRAIASGSLNNNWKELEV